MDWLLLVIISAITLAVASILERVLMKDDKSDPFVYSFVFQIITAVLLFLYAVATGWAVPDLSSLVPNLIVMGVLYAVVNITLFKAYQTTDASDVAILFSTRSIWTMLTAIVLLNEVVDGIRIIGTLLVIGGVVVVSYRKGESFTKNKGYVYTLIAAICFGIAFANDAFIVRSFDSVPSFLAISFFIPAIITLLIRPHAIKNIPLFINMTRLRNMLAASVFYGVSAITIFLAYKAGGDASQISPIGQLSTVFTVFLAFALLKEHDRMWQKIAGAAIVVVGVILLG